MGNNLFRRVSICFLLCALVMCLFSGCRFSLKTDETSLNQTGEGDAEVKLTQRQIQILTEVGLPTNYADLTDSQQNDIMAIEEMICYLEETYKSNATYKTFTQASPVNDESLTVEMDGYIVTVSRHYEAGKYVYTDNFAAEKATDNYENALKAYFEGQNVDVKVYAEITNLKNGTEDILSRANASVFVFVCGERSRNDFEKLVKAYGEWYSSKLNGLANTTRFYMVSDSEYLDVGKANYYDCLQEVSKENRIICVISANGSISVE